MGQLQRISDKLQRATVKETKALLLDINSDLVEQSPVDLGWFTANWIPGIGNLGANTKPVGEPEQFTFDSQLRGEAKVATSLKFGQNAFVGNSTPYADILARGGSSQAAAGWVEDIINSRVAKSNRRRLG